MTSYEKIQLANELNILDVISSFGIDLPQMGDRIVCPICGGENKTKFKIYESNNTFYCFCCCLGGGPIQFASAYLFGSTDHHFSLAAAEYLNRLFGMWTEENQLTKEQRSRIRKIEEEKRHRESEKNRRKKIVQQEEALYQLHKKNEAFYAYAFCNNIPKQSIMNRIIFDCMVMQKQEELQEKISSEKLWQ